MRCEREFSLTSSRTSSSAIRRSDRSSHRSRRLVGHLRAAIALRTLRAARGADTGLEIVCVMGPDDCAPIRLCDDQPFRLEHQQCLSHGRSADPELAGQLLLLQTRPGLQPAVENGSVDQLGRRGACVLNELSTFFEGPATDATIQYANRSSDRIYALRARGSAPATMAPRRARADVVGQKTSQPRWSASAPRGGVQRADTKRRPSERERRNALRDRGRRARRR